MKESDLQVHLDSTLGVTTVFKVRLISLASALSLAIGLAPAVHAYNFFGSGYSPYYGGTNWLWLTRSLSYPFYRGAGYNAPYYLANNLLYSASYGVVGAAQTKARQRAYQQYQDQEPYYNPRQRTRPVVLNGYTGEPITFYPPNKTPVVQPAYGPMGYQGQQAPQTPGLLPDGQSDGPAPDQWLVGGPQPNQPTTSPPAAGGLVAPGQPLATAPQAVVAALPPTQAPAIAPAAQAAAAPVVPVASQASPLAQGFFDLVFSKFDGDLPKALGDRQARAFAKAIGLVDGKDGGSLNLPADRLELIKKIMQDNSEDAMIRVNTVRLLLKH